MACTATGSGAFMGRSKSNTPGAVCGMRYVLDRASKDFLGWVFIRPATISKFAPELGWTRSDEVEVGYRYRRSVWGSGVATEAATPLVQLALADPATTAVVACTLEGNAASLRVLERDIATLWASDFLSVKTWTAQSWSICSSCFSFIPGRGRCLGPASVRTPTPRGCDNKPGTRRCKWTKWGCHCRIW